MTSKSCWRYRSIIDAGVGDRKWIIKNVLRTNQLSTLWGESGAGKSQVALDIAIHVAAGFAWREAKAPRRTVVYIAAEGGDGIKDRVLGWHVLNGKRIGGEDPPFYVYTKPINLMDETSASRLLDTIAEVKEETGDTVGFIIIDTLNATMGMGDENSASDMGYYLNSLRALRAGSENCHIMIIHHCGKDAEKGMRGSYALLAAVDVELQIKGSRNSETFQVEVTKSRDGAPNAGKWAFKKEAVTIGCDEDGDPVTTVVAVPIEVRFNPTLKPQADGIWNTIREDGGERYTRDQLRLLVEPILMRSDKNGNIPGPQSRTNRLTRALKELEDAGYVRVVGKDVEVLGGPA